MNNRLKKSFFLQKGAIALILTLVILTVLLIVALSMADLTLKEIKMSKSVKESLLAYQSADSGIEYALYKIKNGATDLAGLGLVAGEECSGASTKWFDVGNSKYCLEPTIDASGITAVESTGKFRKTRRAVMISFD